MIFHLLQQRDQSKNYRTNKKELTIERLSIFHLPSIRKKIRMLQKAFQIISCLALFTLISLTVNAKSEKFRAMWREDPATTMVIGWNQVSGSNAILHMDDVDHGQDVNAYATVKKPDRVVRAKGMNNFFVRLWGLRPNTTYYFLIKDDEGISQRMSFKTAPDNRGERLSIIAGGDSRNHREARQNANRIVSRLRPHFVMFGGDMTASDNDIEWKRWFDDWQLTTGSDGRLTPIIVTRGNHEAENKSLVDLFDVKNEDCYYALTFGGDLFRAYTLNTLIPADGYQKDWLIRDLQAHPDILWKSAQYHHSIRPHTAEKKIQHDQQFHWAPIFYKYQVNFVVESDAHVVKSTWPIRPCDTKTPGSEGGFIRDDENGTVYVGEGCWGAPLRPNNKDKVWTRNSGSFNQFKWIFIDENQIEIRTIMLDQSRNTAEVEDYDIFTPPAGLKIWNPSQGDVIHIKKKRREPLIEEALVSASQTEEEEPFQESTFQATRTNSEILDARLGAKMKIYNFKAIRSGADIAIKWTTENEVGRVEYEVQRSLGRDANFKTICRVDGKGNSKNDYLYMDRGFAADNPGERVNYRLKQILPSGESAYFDLKDAVQKPDDWSQYPNLGVIPSSGDVAFDYELNRMADVSVLVLNPHLQAVKRVQFRAQKPGFYSQGINIAEVPKGKYLLIIKVEKDVLGKFQLVKT